MLLDPENGLLITLAEGLQAKQWRCAVQLLFTFVCLSLLLAACGRALAPPANQDGDGIRVSVTYDIEADPDLFVSATPSGDESGVLSSEEALRRDVQQYAEEMGVSLDEAMRRFQYMDDIGELNATLNAHEQDTFAGLWVEHQPEFRVIVLFTGRDADRSGQSGDGKRSPGRGFPGRATFHAEETSGYATPQGTSHAYERSGDPTLQAGRVGGPFHRTRADPS